MRRNSPLNSNSRQTFQAVCIHILNGKPLHPFEFVIRVEGISFAKSGSIVASLLTDKGENATISVALLREL